ncbi:MAG: enoyl-CoA hydratase [Candidatus Eremiobacteraeota bacterium]|nr:enoyl-CoA hydratase [Candidatus Eremiobacteraeota bacterium]
MIETGAFGHLELDWVEGGVATVTMRRPEKRNALSLEVMRAMTLAFERIGADADTGAVILRAEGPVFSAGHDLREILACDAEAHRETFDACVRLMETMQRIRQPIVAEVGGIATAAGCQLVATCDLAIASTVAKFATPGVRIGLFCTTPMVALTRAIGRKRAMEMLLTGEAIDAATAADWGLVNRVVAPGQLSAEAMALAQKIVEAAPTTVGLGKAAFYAQIDVPQRDAYAYAAGVMSANARSSDAQEGMTAFVEKRVPVWSAFDEGEPIPDAKV